MAKKRRYTRPTLDPATIIEVVATKGTKVIKTKMTIAESKNMAKKPGWRYQNFEVGFCTLKESKK